MLAPIQKDNSPKGSIAVAILRITLGVIILATWKTNLDGGLYQEDNFVGLLDWLGKSVEDGGNGGTLDFVHSFLDSAVRPYAGIIGSIQLVVELIFGVGLLLGLFTRLSSLLALGFFASLFLSYFGGEEWIWTYVLLIAATVTVLLGNGGRTLGIDKVFGEKKSPLGLLW